MINDNYANLEKVCEELEAKAGISKEMVRARDGRLLPLGVMGEDCTSDEYFADEYDYFRSKCRDAYFSVTNLDMRKALIVARCDIERFVAQCLTHDVAQAQKQLMTAEREALKQPWATAAVVGISCVALGNVMFGIVGGLAGVVAGFFFGMGIVTKAKNENQAKMAEARGELSTAMEDIRKHKRWPGCFSAQEEITGEREVQFDHESAYFNALQNIV